MLSLLSAAILQTRKWSIPLGADYLISIAKNKLKGRVKMLAMITQCVNVPAYRDVLIYQNICNSFTFLFSFEQ